MATEKERLATLEQQAKDANKQLASLFRIVSGHNGSPGLNGRMTMIEETCERIDRHLQRAAKKEQASKTRWLDWVLKIAAGVAIAFLCWRMK